MIDRVFLFFITRDGASFSGKCDGAVKVSVAGAVNFQRLRVSA